MGAGGISQVGGAFAAVHFRLFVYHFFGAYLAGECSTEGAGKTTAPHPRADHSPGHESARALFYLFLGGRLIQVVDWVCHVMAPFKVRTAAGCWLLAAGKSKVQSSTQ